MKKAIRNAVSALLLAIALLVTQIPTTEVQADTSVASDFQINESTLVKYIGTAKAVSIPATVDRIGEEAFAGNTTVKKVEFQGAVETIAYRAFADCSELKEVTVPDTVITLGNGAFAGCEQLEEVHLGKNVKKIGMGAFAGCEKLKSITVDQDNPDFIADDGCLYSRDKTKLYLLIPVRDKETYAMPSTVTDIEPYAFWGCNSVKNISISNVLQEIPAYSFSNCKSLQGLSVPYSVNKIGANAFADCVNLQTAYIPSSVAEIHATAFDGCPKLEIKADMGTTAYQYYEKWKESHKDQSEYEDTGNRGDEDAETEGSAPGIPGSGENGQGAPAGVLGESRVVGNRAFVFIDNSLPVVHNPENDIQPPSEGETEQGDGTETEDILGEADGKAVSIPKFTVAGGKILADQAFYKSDSVADYVMPEGITEIGEFSFARSNLNKIQIPEGVTSIGYGAFYHCDELRNVVIPTTVTDIAPRAFEKTLWIKNWIAGGNDDYLIVGDGILLAYRGRAAEVVLPEKVKKIAPGAFAGHSEIVSVVLSDGLREIGEGAFEGCSSLSAVQGGKYVTKIADRAFSGCGMETFHIAENVKQMGLGAVDYSSTIKSASTKVVVFDSRESLPTVVYEETAGRLSNETARRRVLNDVLVAIVDIGMGADDLAGTVLDHDTYGFEGIVAYISSESRAVVTALSCNMTKAELADSYIPELIQIDGKSYHLEGLDKLEHFDDEAEGPTGDGEVQISNTSQAFSAGGRLHADFTGETGSFLLELKDGEGVREGLDAAFESVYGQKLPGNAVCFDLELLDLDSGVRIHKLGNHSLKIQLPVLKETNSGSVRIVTLDRNGQLENVKYHYGEQGELIMSVSHLSPFAIYHTEGTGNGRLDVSPDTGEGIHPKWFAALGLLSLSAVVFFYRPRKKYSK